MGFLKNIKNYFSEESVKIDDIEFPDSTHIFLIGFSYDIPTEQTISWIENILVKSDRQNKIRRFHNEGSFKKTDLTSVLSNKFERVEIFCGHGNVNGLYGPPFFKTDPSLLKPLHSIIYDNQMIQPGPSSMFAFCCSAAHSFGREFSAIPGNSFMGFTGDILFPTELYKGLQFIFQTLTKDIIENGRIEKRHEDLFIKEIDNLIEKIEEKYRKDPDISDRIGSYLLEYRNLFIVRA